MIRSALATVAVAASLTLVLGACSGTINRSVPAPPAQPAGHERATAYFTIAIPKATGNAAYHRSPRYISPATTSMTLAVTTDPGLASELNLTVPLTSNSQAARRPPPRRCAP